MSDLRTLVTLTICSTCGRDDRWTTLRERHYAFGKICPGPVEKVEFARVLDADLSPITGGIDPDTPTTGWRLPTAAELDARVEAMTPDERVAASWRDGYRTGYYEHALGRPDRLRPDKPTAESDSHTSDPATEVNDESHPTADAATDIDELPLCGCDATGYRHHSACPVMAAHRAQVEAARRDALNQAADDLEGSLGVEGKPQNPFEFRKWLRDRAAGGGA